MYNPTNGFGFINEEDLETKSMIVFVFLKFN